MILLQPSDLRKGNSQELQVRIRAVDIASSTMCLGARVLVRWYSIDESVDKTWIADKVIPL